MIKHFARTCLFIVFILMFSSTIRGETLELADNSGKYSLERYVYSHEDISGSLTTEDIIRMGGIARFTRNRSGTINKGYSDSSWWFGFSLKNMSAIHSRWYLELAFPTMDYFEVYRVQQDKALLLSREGDDFPFAHRAIHFNNFVIPLSLERGTMAEYFIHVKTTSEVIVPLTIWSQDSLMVHSNEQSSALWFYYGLMAVMIIYNLFLFVTIRDINYLYYVFYVLLTTLSNMSFNGIAYQVLWPDFPWFNSISIVLMGNLALVSFMQYSRKFLMTKKYAPSYDRIILAFICIIGFFIAAVPFAKLSFSIISLNTLVLVTTLLALTACTISIKNGYRPAYIYLAAMFFVFLGVSLISLRNFGMLPDTFVTRYGFQIGTSVETVLLSIALGYRFNLLKAENEKLVILRKEIDIARTIYQSILAYQIPRVRGFSIEALVIPMDLIGGDFLEMHSGREGTLGLFLADVSGHGVPASIGAAMLKIAVANNQHLAESPVEFLRGISKTMAGGMGKQFFTATYTFIDTQKMILRHCNAGHSSTFLLRKNVDAITPLNPRGKAIGLFPNESYGMDEISLGTGDRIVFYTDGVIECRNAAGEFFGERRLCDLVLELRHKPIRDVKNEILAALYLWIHPSKAFDDDCALIIAEITS
jgi:serine phosphatase RsbU (regulator of sigma subunit)